MFITSKLIVFTFSTLHNFFYFDSFHFPLFSLSSWPSSALPGDNLFITFFQSHTRVSCICQKPDQATVLYQVRSISLMPMSKFSSFTLCNIKITTTTMKNKINATLFCFLQLHPNLMLPLPSGDKLLFSGLTPFGPKSIQALTTVHHLPKIYFLYFTQNYLSSLFQNKTLNHFPIL